MDAGNLISGSSAFSKTNLNIRKFMVDVLLKPALENFDHSFTSMWDEFNCTVVWAFFGIAFLWDWNENWPFPVQSPGVGNGNLFHYSWTEEPCGLQSMSHKETDTIEWLNTSMRACTHTHIHTSILRLLPRVLTGVLSECIIKIFSKSRDMHIL